MSVDLFTKGWECPKCGAVMSPTTSVCINCTGHCETTVTTNLPSNHSGYCTSREWKEMIEQQVDAFVKCNLMKGKGEGE